MKKLSVVMIMLFIILTLASCDYENGGLNFLTNGVYFEFMSNGDGTCTLKSANIQTDEPITIPEKSPDGDLVVGISDFAFAWESKLTDITIPNSIHTIGDSAFAGCESLEHLDIPYSVTYIGDNAFDNCIGLKIRIDNDTLLSSEAITAYTFYDSLDYNEYDNGLYLGNETNPYLILVKSKGTHITSCKIAPNTKIICNSAFDQCYSINYNQYGNGLYLGNDSNPKLYLVKLQVSSASKFEISVDTQFICNKAFRYAYNLSEIIVDPNNKFYKTENGCLYDFSGENLIRYIPMEEITFTQNLKLIHSNAFYGCNITNITIPDSVIYVGESAFENCQKLQNIILGNQIKHIGNYAFSRCYLMEEIIIPSSVREIGYSSFEECHNLKTVIIGDNIETIHIYTFENCFNLESITIPRSIKSIHSDAFKNCSSLTNVYYKGNERDWKKILINSDNYFLTNSTIHYNYVPEE